MKILILIIFSLPFICNAQTTHTVEPKETLYSLGRQYNILPKELAAYNNIPVETGLVIGQVIKIPKVNASSTTPAVPLKTEPVLKKTETLTEAGSIPVYHKVEKKETLYHISRLYDNITVDDIKRWNNLSADGVSEGTNLIVGYRKANKELPVATTKTVNTESQTKKATVEPVNQISPKEKNDGPEKPVTPETKTIVPKTEPVKEEVNKVTGKNFSGGFFKSLYDEQTSNKSVTEESGTAAIFKSTSGWEDGKYYCLHNTAPAGSVLKITNKTTQKSVYAKVLDVIPDLKQNAGIMIRLSNAAADELGAGENNFEAVLNY